MGPPTSVSNPSQSDRNSQSSKTDSTFESCSSGSTISVMSLSKAPTVQMGERADLEALKKRYIEAISLQQESVKGDQRLDQVELSELSKRESALDAWTAAVYLSASLLSLSVILVLIMTHGHRVPWPFLLVEALIGWLAAIFLDIGIAVCAAVATTGVGSCDWLRADKPWVRQPRLPTRFRQRGRASRGRTP